MLEGFNSRYRDEQPNSALQPTALRAAAELNEEIGDRPRFPQHKPWAVARKAIEIAKIMSFEWDSEKAIANRRKHDVTFEEASSALRDRFSATAHDPDHSEDEDRFVTFGLSSRGRLLAVSHTDHGNAIRIISARIATSAERQLYEEG